MIKIDIDTRCWQIPKEECFLGVESDDKVKILQFELSKNEFCDGLNFTDCNCFINYKNEGNDTIPYGITDMALQEDGTVTFTWEVSRGATIFKGNTFAILCAKKVSEDGTITNEWNSRIGSFTVSKGLEPLSSITEVPEIDIISQLLLVANQANTNAQTNIEKSNSLLEKAEGLGYLKEDFDVLESRMNQFTSLKEGSTTGDAELQDIRVGVDGKTYDNAGDAVRGQISKLKGDLTNINDSIFETVESVGIYNMFNPNDTDLLKDKMFSSAKTGEITDADGSWITGYMDVHNGTGKYLTFLAHTITTGVNTTPLKIGYVCIYDSGKNIIPSTSVITDAYIIPENAYYARVCFSPPNGGNNRKFQFSITENNILEEYTDYTPMTSSLMLKESIIPDYANLKSEVEGLVAAASIDYPVFLGGLNNTGVVPTTSVTRGHSSWMYINGVSSISAPSGYIFKTGFMFDDDYNLLGNATVTESMITITNTKCSFLRLTIAATNGTDDLTDVISTIKIHVDGIKITINRNDLVNGFVPNDLPINPEWSNWNSERYSWGFDKAKDKPFIEAYAPIETDMISVRGGKGRWHSTMGEETDTSATGFCNGGHLFEGWNAEESMRFTILIGKYDKRLACIQTYGSPELNNGQRVFGTVKIGSDNANFGVNFAEKCMKAFVPICLSTSKPTEITPMYEMNNSTDIPVGAMYYETSIDKIKVMTSDGWKSVSLD